MLSKELLDFKEKLYTEFDIPENIVIVFNTVYQLNEQEDLIPVELSQSQLEMISCLYKLSQLIKNN